MLAILIGLQNFKKLIAAKDPKYFLDKKHRDTRAVARIKVTATVADTQQLQWWLRAMQAERLTTPIANDEKLQERQGV